MGSQRLGNCCQVSDISCRLVGSLTSAVPVILDIVLLEMLNSFQAGSKFADFLLRRANFFNYAQVTLTEHLDPILENGLGGYHSFSVY